MTTEPDDTRVAEALPTVGADGRPSLRWGVLIASVWLLYLTSAFEAGWERHDLRGWLGMAAILVFAAVYLLTFLWVRMSSRGAGVVWFRTLGIVRLGLPAVLVQICLSVVICASVGQKGTATTVFIAVMCVMCLPRAWGWCVSVVVAIATFVATLLIPHWYADTGTLFGTLVATLAMWGVMTAIHRNVQMVAMREENARLAVVDERNRFARDLHDILGHSLTVITVKAELAGRLLDVDTERARAELDDLEWLSRDALADVRRAVEGYREVSLPGEIARARLALDAAEIEADLPNSTDVVPTENRELFAWTVREGVTNVIRHSGASRCCVCLGATYVEVRDDGRGPAEDGGTGHGLLGLRERAAARNASLVVTSLRPGFSLRVAMPS